MQPLGGLTSRAATSTLLALLFLLTAVAGAPFGERADEDGASQVVTGDLELADADEGPSDGVEGTFVASEMAPGDRVEGTLTLLRQPFEELPPALEPRLELRVLVDEPDERLPTHLRVTSLRYGGQELTERVEEACGRPLTLASLHRCTAREANPLAGLPDPTPEGRPFELAVELPPEAGNRLQGASARFTVHARLTGQAPGPAIPSPAERLPTTPKASPACPPQPAGPEPRLLELRSPHRAPDAVDLPAAEPWVRHLLEARLPAC